MKCGNCGGEISLEDKECPFCGSINKDAVEHIKAMEEYRKRYENTEKEVTTKTKRFAGMAVKAAILVVLLIGIGITAVVSDRAYGFPEKSRRRAALKDPAACRTIMKENLDNGDYCGYTAYVTYNNIPVYDDRFSDFKNVNYCADYYRDTLASLERIIMHGDDEKWLKWEASSDTGRFCRYLKEFYTSLEDRKGREENEDFKAYYDDMRADMDAAISVYLGMDDDKRTQFLEMSENKMSAYLEEVVLGE